MQNEFALLSQFLQNLEPEVSGHSASPLTAEEIEKIRMFAAGRLGEKERALLLPGILENETALKTLLQSLKGNS